MNAPEVVVIDYGLGNLLSVQRGFEHCGARVTVTANPKDILSANKVVLPGVGAFGTAMEALERMSLVAVIRELAERKTPLLGICLGMQLFLDQSEEFGLTAGLGLIPGRVIPLPRENLEGRSQKIPHIGWSALQPSSGLSAWENTLLHEIRSGESTYFVHSYMAVPSDSVNRIADCVYGGHLVPALIGSDHITGCQFHPEKSGEVGLKILRRFISQ